MLIAATIGGGVGARIAGAAPWKGATIIAVATVLVAALMNILDAKSALLAFIATLICAGVLGAAMKLRGNQTGSVLIGGLLATALVYFAVDTFKFFT